MSKKLLHTFQVDAILFDMDGTLIDSTPGVLAAWHKFAQQYHFDPEEVAHRAHGRRLYDTLREYCQLDDEAEIDRFELEVIEGGLVVLPGGINLLAHLADQAPLEYRWTIVTSATSAYTARALQRCVIPVPPTGYITSDDVTRGKPFPDPYIAGARKCGFDPTNCLVVEDAPSGMTAGRGAGAKTLAVCTSHTRQQIIDSGANPDFIVKDLTKVSIRWSEGTGKVELTLDESDDGI